MSTMAMSGSDTAKINNRILADLADGDCIMLSFPNDIAHVKTGKNGNALFVQNQSGKQAEAVLRLIRGSNDDKFLNNLLANQENNFAQAIALTGEFTKVIGDTQGNLSFDTYILSGGVFSKAIEAKSNVEADTEQSVSVYHVKFAKAARVIT